MLERERYSDNKNNPKPKIIKERISDVERTILEILSEKRRLLSGELYERYEKRVEDPISARAFRDYVNHLAETGLIKISSRKRGLKGKRRVISLS